ncbi:LysR substrate-binding domain-containing protein [Paenibacillus arenosi]|uniref:LysR family transcriptional regulator n=1 Tax=Paenibacillus arenosi TaxID=2774142 RepID=A0ABR9B2C1_9BACL|nr:LysR family transcriptional regulator [Paenibacillus arenosi]
MDIRQLRYFIAIAEERTITGAAAKLRMAQPPLSQQLKQLEQELNVQLVKRHRSGIELTSAGQSLYEHALRIVQFMEESEMEVKEIGSGIRGQLAFGVNTLSDHVLPKLLQAFREKYPKITYKIQQNESAQLCKMIKERAIEVAIIRYPLNLEAFTVMPLRKESLCFVTGTQNICTDRDLWQQLQEVPLILPSTQGLGVHSLIMEQFTGRNIAPNVIGECSDIALLMNLVQSGFASTIIPETVLQMHPGFHVRSVQIEDSTSSSVLIWLKNRYLSKAAQHFIDMCQVYYRE